MNGDPYAVLGVRRGASQEQIRRAYLALARRHHPDHGGDPVTMQRINAAWSELSDPTRRHQPPPPPPRPRPAPPAGGPSRPPAPARRSPVDLAPIGLFAGALLVTFLALALDVPGLLAVAGFLFFISCVGVAAVTILAMRRSARAARH